MIKQIQTSNKVNKNVKLYSFEADGNPYQSYLIYLPDGWSKNSKILVCIHGISRKNKVQIQLLKPYASKNDTILIAPLFSNKYHPSYQRLEVGLDGLRSDELLNNVIIDVENRFLIKIEKFALFGFSAGAQFSHRYAFCYPHKISRLVVCAAGWYTFPNLNLSFPYGVSLGKTKDFINTISETDICDFLSIPITVAVGEEDKYFDSSLNCSKKINEMQGYTRIERAICWTKTLLYECKNRNITPQIKFVLLQKSRHSFTECVKFGSLSNYLS